MSGVLVPILIFLGAVVLRALFSGYETGFVSTNPIRIRFLAEEEREKRAARFLRYAANPDQMLSMLLLGTNCATIIGTMAVVRAAVAVNPYYGEVAAPFIVTPIFLVFTEIMPKSVFRAHPNRLALAFLPIIGAFYLLLTPICAPIARLTRILIRTSGGERHYLSPLMTSRDDVRVLVDESADHGTIAPAEQKMIHSVINLQGKLAKEIMVPRVDIQALPDTASRAELLEMFVESGRTRIPIYQETIDTIIGVANAHAVLLDTQPEQESITRFAQDVMHVPDTVGVDALLETLKGAKQHMAIVTDEYGGTDGLVTIEDILEEIFGEIQDEHDEEEHSIQEVGPRAYVIDARTSLDEVSDVIGIELTEEGVDTMGGLTLRVAGRIPSRGEVVEEGPLRITILDGDPSHVLKVRLDIRTPLEEPHAQKE